MYPLVFFSFQPLVSYSGWVFWGGFLVLFYSFVVVVFLFKYNNMYITIFDVDDDDVGGDNNFDINTYGNNIDRDDKN